MFVASLSKIKMDCLGIRFYWLFICDRGPQSKSINQSAVAGSKFATNENIFCCFSVAFTLIAKMAMCCPQHTPPIIIMVHLWTSLVPFRVIWTKSKRTATFFREAFPNTKYGLVIIKGTSLPPMKISFPVASLLQSWPYAARRAKACSTNDH